MNCYCYCIGVSVACNLLYGKKVLTVDRRGPSNGSEWGHGSRSCMVLGLLVAAGRKSRFVASIDGTHKEGLVSSL